MASPSNGRPGPLQTGVREPRTRGWQPPPPDAPLPRPPTGGRSMPVAAGGSVFHGTDQAGEAPPHERHR
eukprot:2910044-Pyramimonas_sp.AAC.1